MQANPLNLDLLIAGGGIKNILSELEVIPDDLVERMAAHATGSSDSSETRCLAVLDNGSTIFTSEDIKYEKNGATESLRLLMKLHRIGAVNILSINDVELSLAADH